MIKTLYIKNLAIIKEIKVEFSAHLNIITGETGSGKSIIINAINNEPSITMVTDSYFDFEDSEYFTLEPILIDDPDVNEGDGIMQLTIDCQGCRVEMPPPNDGLNFTSIEDNLIIFSGRVLKSIIVDPSEVRFLSL